MRCGSLPNTWTYSGIDVAYDLPVYATSDKIDINPSSGAITVDKSMPVGTYKIKVIGTLPNNY